METGETEIIFIIVGFSHGAHVKLWTWNAKSRKEQKSEEARPKNMEGGMAAEVGKEWVSEQEREREGLTLISCDS